MATLRMNRWVVGALALATLTTCSFLSCGTPGLSSSPPAQQEPLLQDASIPDVVERVSPAVVSIYTSRPVAVVTPYDLPFGGPRGEQQSLGSGAIVAADGRFVRTPRLDAQSCLASSSATRASCAC